MYEGLEPASDAQNRVEAEREYQGRPLGVHGHTTPGLCDESVAHDRARARA